MCGISGFWSCKSPHGDEKARHILDKMNASLNHRGPDEGGIYVDKTTTLGLAHRRLSIVDLTPTGSQPMFSKSGRYVIVYNGELYNTEGLSLDLKSKGVKFKGHSDTEVLIEAIEIYGIEETLRKANGMFSFAAFDTTDRVLFIARDQIGIKPLFWSYRNDTFVFGSELKALMVYPSWSAEMDVSSLNDFFLHNYISGQQTIFKDTYKLLPGHYLRVTEDAPPKIFQYWSTSDSSSNDRLKIDKEDLVDYFEGLISGAIRRQMISDVPLGVFLSGGIDSSLVAALMQKNSTTPIKTFTIGFEEDQYNESRYAREVAKHIGSEHHEELLSVTRAQDLISSLPECYDEPFADSSQLPTMLLSQFTRNHVTVSLSGDGGDELFLGYKRYFDAKKMFRILDKFSMLPLSKQALDLMSRIPYPENPILPENMGIKFRKMANMIEFSSPQDRYRELTSLWTRGQSPIRRDVLNADAPNVSFSPCQSDIMEYMRLVDFGAYLPDDILQKTDRASMAYSLEARVPLLDLEIVTAALGIPTEWHIQGGREKYILRSILERHIPKALFERPKHGFSVPIGHWLRGDLRDFAETYLNKTSLEECEFLDSEKIGLRWKQHLAGTHNWQHSLWGILMFQIWRSKYRL